MPLSDAAVIRSVVRHKLVTPEQLWGALEASDTRPLLDVLRERGLADEEKILASLTQTVVAERATAGYDATVVRSTGPEGPAVDSTRRLGKFVLDRKVGEGGMGEVWKATQVDLGRTVALKLLLRVGDEDLARFRQEAQLAASLHHPHIALIYEVGEIERRPYLAMQYIEGQTLSGLRLPVRRALEVLRDAAEGVQHAHQRGIVHRDIKPGNIMTDADGRVYVMDFGLARAARDPGSQGITVSGEILGTPTYMSPEQARSLPHLVGPATDVWALGVTLYEILTGARPFGGKNLGELFANISSSDPVPPSRHAGKVDRDVETIVLKCLEKEPSRRYANAGELASDLSRALRGDPILARRPAWGERLVRRAGRYPGVVMGVALAALLSVPVSMIFTSREGAIPLKEQFERAKASGDYEKMATLPGDDSTVHDSVAAAMTARDEAARGENRRNAAELLEIGAALEARSREHAIAACAAAVGLDPSNRDARVRLAGLLGPGPAADILLAPLPGEARLDVESDPPGARIDIVGGFKPPFVPAGDRILHLTMEGRAEGWIQLRLEKDDWKRLRIRLAGTPPPGYLWFPDEDGTGFYLPIEPQPAVPRSEAEAAAKAAGGRLPTRAELARAQSIWGRAAGKAGGSPGKAWEWVSETDHDGLRLAPGASPGAAGKAAFRIVREER